MSSKEERELLGVGYYEENEKLVFYPGEVNLLQKRFTLLYENYRYNSGDFLKIYKAENRLL
jgi:hypothetical protein